MHIRSIVQWIVMGLVLPAGILGCEGQNQAKLHWPSPSGPIASSSLPDVHWGKKPPRPAPRPTRRPVKVRPEKPARGQWHIDGQREWRYIVIHHSATEFGSASLFDRQHRRRGWDELGYHFVITNGHGGADGSIQVGSRWRKQKHGAHCGGTPGNEYNEHGIGICLVGDFTRNMPTPQQMESLTELIYELMRAYDIPPENVIAHRDAPNAATECCGRRLYGYLNRSLRPTLRSGTYAHAEK